MRRRLILLTTAVTGLVVLAFLVPLFLLVGDLARDDALSVAEREAESLARTLSVLVIEHEVLAATEIVGDDRIVAVNASVILPDGSVVGLFVPINEDISPAKSGSSFLSLVEGGVAVYVPVLTDKGDAVVVRVFVPETSLTEGVFQSRLVLGVLGLILIVIAAWIADWLGKSMVDPVRELSDIALRLGRGDLDARVVPGGPLEIEEAGIEFNRLAEQIGRLLQEERETAADLAHRLRTPLTAARLSVDGLEDGEHKERLIVDLDDLQRTTDHIIREARRPVRRGEEEWCDLALVASERSEFWLALALEQCREMPVHITSDVIPVSLPTGDIAAAIDALIENVLSHTPDGVSLSISVGVVGNEGVLSVEDAGSGFPGGTELDRGVSSVGSTGLGLDIVRRTAEEVGGSMILGDSVLLGGAMVRLSLPLMSAR